MLRPEHLDDPGFNTSFFFIALSLLWIHSFTTLVTTLLTYLTIKSVRTNNASSRATSNSNIVLSQWDKVLKVVTSVLEAITEICVVQALFQTRSITLPVLFYVSSELRNLLEIPSRRGAWIPLASFERILLTLNSICPKL